MGNSVEGTSTYDDKLKIMKEGNSCPAPPLLVYKNKVRKFEYTRNFLTLQNRSVEGITDCKIQPICWPCLLFPKRVVWNKHLTSTV
jgi:hypothetical protein